MASRRRRTRHGRGGVTAPASQPCVSPPRAHFAVWPRASAVAVVVRCFASVVPARLQASAANCLSRACCSSSLAASCWQRDDLLTSTCQSLTACSPRRPRACRAPAHRRRAPNTACGVHGQKVRVPVCVQRASAAASGIIASCLQSLLKTTTKQSLRWPAAKSAHSRARAHN